MGRVFLGRSPGGRLVAVKVIRAELAEQAEFRDRFVREVAAARTVSGVFTAAVVEADVDAPVPWLATAYVSGLSLADTITRHGPLPATSVLALAAGLAEGLGAIHAAGIVHRDLKPSNVLLAEDGPRIIDFGISRAAEANVLTGTGVVFGSPSFMSPEQARGELVGPPSDVFSLGAVLSFAATGQGPFGTGSSATLLYRVVFTPPDTSGLPAGLRALVDRCLAKDPEQRPITEQLLAELNTAPPTAGWLPASITQTFPSQPSPEPGPASPTADDDLPPMQAPQPTWVPRARTGKREADIVSEDRTAPGGGRDPGTRRQPGTRAAGPLPPGIGRRRRGSRTPDRLSRRGHDRTAASIRPGDNRALVTRTSDERPRFTWTSAIPDGDFPGDLAADVPGYVPADVPAYLAADVPGYVPADVPRYVPADVPRYVPADVPRYVPADLSSHVPVDVPGHLLGRFMSAPGSSCTRAARRHLGASRLS
jgi:serine/threonine protein kinase